MRGGCQYLCRELCRELCRSHFRQSSRQSSRQSFQEPRTHAFTLVEIALAMLAFSLGILSFFALLSLGLNQELESQHQTRAAEFADSTLRGLRAISDHLSETAEGNEWSQFWRSLRDGGTNIMVTANGTNGVWNPPPVIRGDNQSFGGHHTATFTQHPMHGSSQSNIVSHIIRYRMRVDVGRMILVEDEWQLRPDPDNFDTLAIVTLRVWEGESGRSADNEALIFYTEYTDRGAVR